MNTGEWILVGVGAAQAVALAVAALFAWLTYTAAGMSAMQPVFNR